MFGKNTLYTFEYSDRVLRVVFPNTMYSIKANIAKVLCINCPCRGSCSIQKTLAIDIQTIKLIDRISGNVMKIINPLNILEYLKRVNKLIISEKIECVDLFLISDLNKILISGRLILSKSSRNDNCEHKLECVPRCVICDIDIEDYFSSEKIPTRPSPGVLNDKAFDKTT